ncbi:MAG: hypothetical protein JO316_19720 [Abitibacteriaceae bacterium]|nr:hypothetical protein [Abditibacteriaceae bacterium]MBV9867585.1 hypothetical protein [Abditibacteriaceae bacterium]
MMTQWKWRASAVYLLWAGCILWVDLLPVSARQYRQWGRIANRHYRGQPILSALYFAGPPNPHALPLYTRHPAQPEPINWFDNANIDAALKPMRMVGLNTIKLSYWGHDGETDDWSPTWLFSRTRWPDDRRYHDPHYSSHSTNDRYTEAEQVALARRFFKRATRQRLLFAPMLEVSRSFPFFIDFPDRIDDLVQRCTWLLKHFGKSSNWVRIYDQNGHSRYVIWLIETIHATPCDPARFAAAFDTAALSIRKATGYQVGFILDPTPLPAYGSHAGPTPATLRRCASVLAINPYNITAQGNAHPKPQRDLTEEERLEYAESILSQWSASGIPLLVPIIPGYDAHLAFPGNGSYGFNTAWRERERQLAARYGANGLSIDTWNGWTEGYAIPPSQEDSDVHLRWVREVLHSLPYKAPPQKRSG